MTVVVYKEGVMASDSLASWGNRPSSEQKIWNTENALLGIAGAIVAKRFVLEWLREQHNGINEDLSCDIPELYKLDYTAMIVCKRSGDVFFLGSGEDDVISIEKMSKVEAIGVGRSLALGALAMGATAQRAVRVAIENNIYCGGEIQKISLLDNGFE